MTQKEKADNFIDRLQRVINNAGNIMVLVEDLEEAFPELKERNDERIREELIDAINGLWDEDSLPMPLSGKRKDAWLFWLEKQKPINKIPHLPDGSIAYDKEYEDAQKYLSERGFDIPWNDNDVFVDERYITQTIANVLAWGDEHPNQKVSRLERQGESKIVWHSVSEEPDELVELLCEWESDDATWHDVAFYHADTKTFWRCKQEIKNVTKWARIK